jgi:hypothetical protein
MAHTKHPHPETGVPSQKIFACIIGQSVGIW